MVCVKHSEVLWVEHGKCDGKCEGLGVRGGNERYGAKTQRTLINHVKEQNLTGDFPSAMMEILTDSWP